MRVDGRWEGKEGVSEREEEESCEKKKKEEERRELNYEPGGE